MDNELFEKIAEFKRLETIPGGTNQDVDIRWGQLCHELTPLLVTERDAQAARIAELQAQLRTLEVNMQLVEASRDVALSELAEWTAQYKGAKALSDIFRRNE